MKYRFRARNRLIAALSDLVIVVEARLPSGTLSTVNHALELDVPVAAVPGSILCLESAAPNRLIGEGAFPICCREDLAVACNLSNSRSNFGKLYKDFESVEPGKRSKSDRGVQASFAFESEAESHASKIYASIQSMPALPDELAHDLNLSLGEVLETLGHFEVQGHVVRSADGRYGVGDSLC
jgi:predicted Rossmann fold nucleotide-binding protein DprA/Smf involved in DNA uptake